jgi:hypothetical protein
MAPNLAESQHAQIRDMILSNCPPAEIADVVSCSERSVFAIQSNLRLHNCFQSPPSNVMDITQKYAAAAAGGVFFIFILVNLRPHITPLIGHISLFTSKHPTYLYLIYRHRFQGPWSLADGLI